MGTCDHSAETDCNSPRKFGADETKEVAGNSLGERLGNFVVEPLSSLHISSHSPRGGGDNAVAQSIHEGNCCSNSDEVDTLTARNSNSNSTDGNPVTASGDTSYGVLAEMADLERGYAVHDPESGNVLTIERGLSRMHFHETGGKSEAYPCPTEVKLVVAPNGRQNESDNTAGGDKPSVESLVDIVSDNTHIGFVNDGSSKSLVMPDGFRMNDVAAAFNSTHVESIDHANSEGKGDSRIDDDARELKCPNAPSLSLRRSSRSRKSVQKVQTDKHAINRKEPSNSLRCAKIDLLSKATRKKRSFLSRSVCSSGWGSSANLSKYFQWSNEVIVGKVRDKGSRKGKASQRIRKRNTVKASSQQSAGKQGVISRPIRLKVKFGKKEDQNKLEGMPPVGIDALADGQPGNNDNQPGFCSFMDRTVGDVIDDLVLKEMPRLTQCSNIVANVQFTRTDIEIYSMSGKSSLNDSFQSQSEKLASSYADKYLDPGTSPDSEVIDHVLDSTTALRASTTLYNPENMVSKDTAFPETISCPISLKTSKKKRNKKDKLCHVGGLDVDGKLLCQEKSVEAKVSKKGGRRHKISIGIYSTDAGINTPSENPSSNTYGSELVSMELLSVSEGGSRKAPSLENGADSNSCSVMGIESADSGNSCQFLPPDGTQGKRSFKGSKAKGKPRNKSKMFDAKRNQKEPSIKCKVNRKKLPGRSKVSENGILDDIHKIDGKSETGKHSVVDIGKADTSNELPPENVPCLAIPPTGVGEQTLPPRNAWVCCDDCQKWRCIPAELADVLEASNCRWTCKDNNDQSFADCTILQEKSNSEINAELQISDDDVRDSLLGLKGNGVQHAVAPQLSTWMLVKSNLFLHRSRRTQTMDEIMVCHCKPSADGSLGCGSECLNRMLNIECVQGTCPCGDLCSNQQFQKRQYTNLSWFRCGKKGYGLQVLEDISEGQFLIEYVGEVLDLQAYEARQKDYAAKGHKHFYFMTLNGNEVIDACAKGNLGRFVNHSCDPNCRTEKWVVNGEICVGLFALRNIRKGEELTFDYNYVRVFGAAAKKCHCGSSKCRGYIGGDPLKAEVIVQGDSDEEFPEPVVVYENGEVDHEVVDMMAKSSLQDVERFTNEDNLCEEDSEIILEDEGITNNKESPVDVGGQSMTLIEKEAIDEDHESSDNLGALQTEDVRNEHVSAVQQQTSTTEQIISTSTSSPESDISPEKRTVSSSLSGSIDSNSRISEVDVVGCERPHSKPRPRMKISRPSKSVKKRKSNGSSSSADKGLIIPHKAQVLSYKPKKLLEGSANGHLEAVEEKLNELLDGDGGISKRKDGSKGYLKLLLLTAASGDSGNGGAIQSNRDLSMILDGILKTKSRGVLVDIINKNGLQMLHNMMKLYRRDFKKIPILRKLLKVLEFLAEREILTVERINADPLCPGVESFRESILALTEHDDKKVHQIARNFRDRWIPRPIRKFNGIEHADRRREFNRGSNCSRYFGMFPQWRDHGGRPSEAIDCVKQSAIANDPVDTKMHDASSPQVNDGQAIVSRPRKRKSRWDQPADPLSPRRTKEPRIELCSPREIETNPKAIEVRKEEEVMQNTKDDAPPGFSSPPNSEEDAPPGFSSLRKPEDAPAFSSLHPPQNSAPLTCPSVVPTGHLQERFNPRLPVAYGIPFSDVQQFGALKSGIVDSWAIAPAMPFQPFPPLPTYPRDKRDRPRPCANECVMMTGDCEELRWDDYFNTDDSHKDQGCPSTSGSGLAHLQNAGMTDPNMLMHHERGFSNGPWRSYRPQRWNNPKPPPPWLRRRNGWSFKGNNHPSNEVYNMSMETIANDQNSPV